MGEFSIWHWLIVLAVILLLFGGAKVSSLMGELAKGIKAFKQTMTEDERPPQCPASRPKIRRVSVTDRSLISGVA
jgi:sec-independent protein translocase protein TatA